MSVRDFNSMGGVVGDGISLRTDEIETRRPAAFAYTRRCVSRR